MLTGRYACYDIYRCRDGRWLAVGAIEPHFYANLCRRSAASSGSRTRPTTPRRSEIRADFARRLRDARPRRLGGRARAGRHLRRARATRSTSWSRDPQLRARAACSPRREHPSAGRFRQLAPAARGHAAPRPSRSRVPRRRAPPTPTRCSRAAGFAPDEIARCAARAWSRERRRRRMSDAAGRGAQPGSARSATSRRASSTSSAATSSRPARRSQNGNPLFWDEKAAQRDHRRLDRAAHDDLGLVPPAPLVAGPHRAGACRSRCTST